MRKICSGIMMVLLATAWHQHAYAFVKPSALPIRAVKQQAEGKTLVDYQRNIKPLHRPRMAVVRPNMNGGKRDNQVTEKPLADAKSSPSQQLLSIYGE